MKSSHLFLAVGLCLVVGDTSARANEIFRFDPSRSTIEFKVRHFFGTAKGKFTKFSGTIEVDREHPEKSTVTATIQAASIDTAMLLGAAENQISHWRITTAPLKRGEFGLSWSKSVEAVSMIGDEVAVTIEIEATRAQ
jgi:polyisoprenoid-binding protein YceI